MLTAGVSAVAAALDQRLRDRRQGGGAHEHDDGVDGRGEAAPVDAAIGLVVVLVAGDDGEGRGEAAVGDRHAGVGGRGDGGSDAGDDLEGDAGGCERERFLAAAAEDEGVAALEAHDAHARRGPSRRAGR